ncbi:outer membrane beta-barrel protein [Derxia lacustris]|uniref:outer membrane beta-barrel protein n=1 Tax=Derxia lacustris TaxID=764842 RepID=UPI000A176DC1|nr:outer membrane beta-barrel protein [Derxia lacustris]
MNSPSVPRGLVRLAIATAALGPGWCITAQSQALVPFDATPERTGITYSAGMTVSSDNNILRLPDGVTPNDRNSSLGAKRADITYAPYLDVNARANVSRQRFVVDANVRYNAYRDYTQFNSTLVNGSATWFWQLGNEFDGTLIYGRDETQTAIANQSQSLSALVAGLNQLQTDRLDFVGNYRPRPDRRLTLSAGHRESTNSSSSLRTNDNKISTVGVQAGYINGRNDDFYLYGTLTDGQYPNRVILVTAPIDNSYTQREFGAGLIYRPGGFTEAQTSIGWARRHHDQVPERDFWGPVASLTLRYQFTGKLRAELTGGRSVSGTDAYDRVYSLTSSLDGKLSYSVTPKVTANVESMWRRDDYRGDPNSIQSNLTTRPARLDNSLQHTLGLDWLPYDRWQVGFQLQRVTRSSNLLNTDGTPLYDYKANVVMVTTQYRFR